MSSFVLNGTQFFLKAKDCYSAAMYSLPAGSVPSGEYPPFFQLCYFGLESCFSDRAVSVQKLLDLLQLKSQLLIKPDQANPLSFRFSIKQMSIFIFRKQLPALLFISLDRPLGNFQFSAYLAQCSFHLHFLLTVKLHAACSQRTLQKNCIPQQGLQFLRGVGGKW